MQKFSYPKKMHLLTANTFTWFKYIFSLHEKAFPGAVSQRTGKTNVPGATEYTVLRDSILTVAAGAMAPYDQLSRQTRNTAACILLHPVLWRFTFLSMNYYLKLVYKITDKMFICVYKFMHIILVHIS